MSRFAIVDGSGNVASISSNGALLIAGTAAISGANVSTSAVEVLVRPASSKAVSVSSGTVKASAGTLYTILPTTAGDIDIKDGNTSIARIASTTAPFNFYPGIPFRTNISISASAGVATFIYT